MKPRALSRPPAKLMAPCGPLEHPDRADPHTARSQKIVQMQRIPGFRLMGDPGLEPGPSSLSGKPSVPSSRPNSNLIPANACNSMIGRRLETTGRYNLVAPSWPHDRGSRAGCRMARKRRSCRPYGQARTLGRRPAPRHHDRVDRREYRRLAELVHHVTRRCRWGRFQPASRAQRPRCGPESCLRASLLVMRGARNRRPAGARSFTCLDVLTAGEAFGSDPRSRPSLMTKMVATQAVGKVRGAWGVHPVQLSAVTFVRQSPPCALPLNESCGRGSRLLSGLTGWRCSYRLNAPRPGLTSVVLNGSG